MLVCLLALAVRLLLPALHTHTHTHRAAANGPTPVACSCGHHHATSRAGRRDERAVESPADALAETACLACEIELSTPGAPPPPPILLVHRGAPGAPAEVAADEVRPVDLVFAPPSRAPPSTRAGSVAERRRTA